MEQQTRLPEFGREFTWHNYNESQTREKALFINLLKELCDLIEEPNHGKGRKPSKLRDIIFSIVLKQYLNTSARRVQRMEGLQEMPCNLWCEDKRNNFC